MNKYRQIFSFKEGRFSEQESLYLSKMIAKDYNCDLAIPNAPGLGNILMYTRLVAELSRKLNRPIDILTSPINLKVGSTKKEIDFPVWHNSPYINKIINIDNVEIMNFINKDKDDLYQYRHIIENLCFSYNLETRNVSPEIFLTKEEMQNAFKKVKNLKRPIICIHPNGKSSSNKDSYWYKENWNSLVNTLDKYASFIQIGLFDKLNNNKVLFLNTTIREMMALIWVSDFFIGFDSGPTHIATAFDKKAIVLWDIMKKRLLEQNKEPGFETSMLLRWSYPQNENIMIYAERNNESLKIVLDKCYKLLL